MQDNDEFKPFIPANEKPKEITPMSVLVGILLAVVFGGANAYLGLRVGMTISASIPAAVISMGIFRILLKRNSILENNMVQTIGSAGESVAAGAIFAIPTIFMWLEEWGEEPPSLLSISAISLCGGLLGVMFMIPLRKALIVRENGILPYPEGKACAEVLLAGEDGGSKASTVFRGLGFSVIYKFIADGMKLFYSEVHFELNRFKGAAVGIDVLPALVGAGYICGFKISSYMFSGGILSWLVIMPLLSLFGGGNILFPADTPVNTLESFELWRYYVRYIGAGAVAAGGIISLVKSLPLIASTFVHIFKDNVHKKNSSAKVLRTEKDIPIKYIVILTIGIMIFMWLFPSIPVSLIGAVIIAVFGFFFATVSSRLVGLVGSSNNPVSGMSIATLLISAVILKLTGNGGRAGMLGAISIGAVICIVSAIAGDTSQDLKTGHILGATPIKQQCGEFIGVGFAAVTIGGILFLLSKAWGYGSVQLPAPQAMLMKMVVEGVMDGNLPWTLVAAGVGIAVLVELLGIPVLPFTVGLYLPIHLSAGIMAGGIVRLYFDKKKNISDDDRKRRISSGVLYTSGLIAGEGLTGIFLAVLAVIPFGAGVIADVVDISHIISFGSFGGLVALVLLLLSILFV